ncbi:DNA/RNA non-specific endonuclease [Nonomuraea sp. NPDC050643]|uniref:DNA/RNA non-specific endonuclease n=1 Tax=Nonomuraea sp. NPDC050643 TaxID=3155660 RepID=UPI0033EDD8D4
MIAITGAAAVSSAGQAATLVSLSGRLEPPPVTASPRNPRQPVASPRSTKQPVATPRSAGIPCVKYLAKNHTYRSIWAYTTDDLGRPHQAQAGNLTSQTQRRSKCEQEVGQWGGPNHQGGHMIAATLKGTSQRANLVPVTTQVNLTLMKAFENQAKRCLSTPNRQVLNYTTTAFYKRNDSGVVPDHLTMSMVIQRDRDQNKRGLVTMAFRNIAYGKGPMKTMVNRMKDAAREAGCAAS